ncbi:MAG TPA: alpha/beta hydrolase-fold protein [Puia sp.]|nr:alpha/beta hydrolase-fold protein [Puia sp.]
MRYITALLILLGLESCSQPDNRIVIGKKDHIYSNILKENREIWVHLPQSMNSSVFGSSRYPVIYLLDGDGHFSSVTGLLEQLTEINGNMLFPEMIVVGITNTDRMRDLTPTHTQLNFAGDSSQPSTSGGGGEFISFIEKELIPHIDSLYPTAPYRIFIGHSLGGLTVINTLMHHPQIFNSYLAIDPSMWWDRRSLLKQTGSILMQNNFKGKTLFLGVANTMSPGLDTATVRKDTILSNQHIRSILSLTDSLKKATGNGLRWEYKYYSEDSHGSVPLISEYDGLRFIFDFYNFKNANQLFQKDVSAEMAVMSLKDHYREISQEMGYEVTPPEDYVNNLGYGLLQNKMNEKAFAFFKLNIDNYPKSGNVYDSMGDYYVAINDKAKAIENFKKALTLFNNPDTKGKLEKLEQGK